MLSVLSGILKKSLCLGDKSEYRPGARRCPRPPEILKAAGLHVPGYVSSLRVSDRWILHCRCFLEAARLELIPASSFLHPG